MSMQTLYDTLLHHNYTTAQSKQIFTIQRSAKYREPQKVNIGPDIQPHNLTWNILYYLINHFKSYMSHYHN